MKKLRKSLRNLSLILILTLTAVPINGFKSPKIDWHFPLDDIVENILLYMPLGFAYGEAGALTVITRAGALSLVIESAQAFYKERFSQPSDVISNTIGAALGVAVYRFVARRRSAS